MSFDKNQVYCVLDYETYSEAPLPKIGASEYSRHPSTEILCAAYRIGTRETLKTAKTKWFVPSIALSSIDFFSALRDERFILVAHNALFEQVITNNVLGVKYKVVKNNPPSRWICTASLAAALALPRKLEGAAEVLKLRTQKDKEGNRLIQKWCKPKRPSKKDPGTRHTNQKEFDRIVKYCMTDVDATVELFLRCPPLTDNERKIWLLDQKINMRGFQVDRPLVKSVLKMIKEETKVLDKETQELSLGVLESANQRDGVLDFLECENLFLPDLKKKTVEDALAAGLAQGDAKRMLEIRLSVSKTSTAKYQALESRSRSDGRLRDILLYCAASTGRWGGMGFQPQNLPRGDIKNTIQAAEILREGDLELTRLIYGDPMNAFSSCLRNTIIAPPGKVLDVADYAAIEARVLAWVAKDEPALKAFRDGVDSYRNLASKIFGVKVEDVTTDQRFVGKQAELGCGYQMGKVKFKSTCLNLGKEVSDELAEMAVKTFRASHPAIVKLWDNTQRAAIAAVQNPGKRYSINRVTWFVQGEFLFCELPSKRRLAYHKPSVRYDKTPWGDKRPVLYHWGSNSLSKKWENQKTYGGRLVENVVQAISRDLMAEAMLRIEATDVWQIVLSVHDELIAERDLRYGNTNKDFCDLMQELPEWAAGLPMKVEGWAGARYKK